MDIKYKLWYFDAKITPKRENYALHRMKKLNVGILTTGAISAALMLYYKQTKTATVKINNTESREKVGVNKRFFEQLKFLLRICIPSCILTL